MVDFLTVVFTFFQMKKAVDILNSDRSRSLAHILSSRGIRHFSLISYPLVCTYVVIYSFSGCLSTALLLICDHHLSTAVFSQSVHIILRQVYMEVGFCCSYLAETGEEN